MIDLVPQPLQSVRADLDDLGLPGSVLAHLTSSSAPAAGDPPFVQLAYDEIGEAQLEAALGLYSITKSNSPIGLPRVLPPIEWPPEAPEILLFSLFDLRDHLVRIEPELGAHVLSEDFDSYIARLAGEDLTALQYLVGGTLECVKFCLAHDWALSVRW